MFHIKFVEEIKTHIFVFSDFSENRAIYEKMSENMVEPERPQMTIWGRIACLISKATRAQAHARACAPTRTLAHPLTRGQARARTRTHIHIYTPEMCNTQCFSTAKMVSSWCYVICTLLLFWWRNLPHVGSQVQTLSVKNVTLESEADRTELSKQQTSNFRMEERSVTSYESTRRLIPQESNGLSSPVSEVKLFALYRKVPPLGPAQSVSHSCCIYPTHS